MEKKSYITFALSCNRQETDKQKGGREKEKLVSRAGGVSFVGRVVIAVEMQGRWVEQRNCECERIPLNIEYNACVWIGVGYEQGMDRYGDGASPTKQ